MPPPAAIVHRTASTQASGPNGYRRLTTLLDQLGSQAAVFVGRNRSCRLQLIELHDLVRGAEPDDMAQLFPGLTSLGLVSLGHAPSLGEKIGEHADVGNQDERDHPQHLGEAGHVMPAEQVARRDDEQPEPQYEHEYREGVSDELVKVNPPSNSIVVPPALPVALRSF